MISTKYIIRINFTCFILLSVATSKCRIPTVICIIFELNSTGAGHASEFSDLKIEETGYIYLLAPIHHWLNTALESGGGGGS